MNNKKVLKLYIDGASKGNPGESGVGVILKVDEQIIGEKKKYIGKTTNNVAEYKAVIVGLNEAKRFEFDCVEIFSDSELLVKQLTGEYKVKSDKLKDLFEQIRELSEEFTHINIEKIPRENNKKADKLASLAIKENRGIFPKKPS